jgi:high-affinity Fe2+/Pb2+ permease
LSVCVIMSRERHPRDECFGLPNSGAIAGIVFGVLIILGGLSVLFEWEINMMAVLIVLLGLLVVSGTLYRMTRS